MKFSQSYAEPKKNPAGKRAPRLYPFYIVGFRTFAGKAAATRYAKRTNQKVVTVNDAAEARAASVKKNPVKRISSTAANAFLAAPAKRRGKTRRIGSPHAPFYVQLRNRKALTWTTLAQFAVQALAVDYAKALKRRYPSKDFRVFWK